MAFNFPVPPICMYVFIYSFPSLETSKFKSGFRQVALGRDLESRDLTGSCILSRGKRELLSARQTSTGPKPPRILAEDETQVSFPNQNKIGDLQNNMVASDVYGKDLFCFVCFT